MVFQYHYLAGSRVPDWLKGGWAGVDIFFVLSGFLITGILFDSRERPYRSRNFYVRRALRVFPLYYGVFLVINVSTPLFQWMWSGSCALWLVYLGNLRHFLQPGQTESVPLNLVSQRFNLSAHLIHFWTLCVEEQFYMVWPFVVFFVSDRVRLRNLCFAIVALCPLFRLAVFHFTSQAVLEGKFLVFSTPFRVDALMLGGALALMLRGPEAERLRRSASSLLVGAVFTLCGRLDHCRFCLTPEIHVG